MNPPPDSSSSADPNEIRSQINYTRRRMDETINALGRRFEGRHLVDEALNLVRKQTENGKMTQLTNQLKHSADTAVHNVVDTVKANPIPAALIGAGIAWYVYSQTHDSSRTHHFDYAEEEDRFRGYADDPLAENAGNSAGTYADDETGEVRERIREKNGELRERSRKAVHHVRERAGQLGSKARQRSREMLHDGRERISATVDRHPLESGLVLLALGLVAGLAMPASRRVRSAVAPGARKLRERGEDMLERGRQVARTAADAAKQEAEAQGLASRPQKSAMPGGIPPGTQATAPSI
jgi:ElaB/YqjD/DUF883 family membrane-anchored ribosome-binding protein